MNKLLHGRIAVNRFTLKLLRKKLGYSQEKLADECLKRRLPVSVPSIKRAEAGKNVLYRTAVNLATFFDVSIEDLVGDVPLSLWEYSKNYSQPCAPCIGREWELSQLQSLHKLARSSQKLVCICGIQGIGKTNLICQFLHFLEHSETKVLYTALHLSCDVLSSFCRAILALDNHQDDDAIRDDLKAIANTSLVYFFLLRLIGVTLHKTEACALESLGGDRLQEIELLAITLLVEQMVARQIETVALDGLCCADEAQLRFVQVLVEVSRHQPLLIVFGCTDMDQSSYLPHWLEHSHVIPLRPLDGEACESLARLCLRNQPLHPSKFAEHKRISIERSNGHPGILKALLGSSEPRQACPEHFRLSILRRLSNLTMTQCALLKFIACIGVAVRVEYIDHFLSNKSIRGVALLHELVRLGFISPKANSYVFRHALIWEIVASQVEESDREYCKMLAKKYCFVSK